MTINDLPTVGYLDQWFHVLLAAQQPSAPAPAEVVLYSAQKLAAVCDVDPATVRRWLNVGKTGRDGQPLKLRAFYFNSEARIPWPALLAYERGEDFDLATLPAPTASAPEVVPAEAPALRVAS